MSAYAARIVQFRLNLSAAFWRSAAGGKISEMSSGKTSVIHLNIRPHIVPFVVLVGIYFAVRPYIGVVHDARFYALDALARQGSHARGAADLAQDVYLRFGSQGDFSLFPLLYGPVLRLIGTSDGAALCWAVTSVLWVSGYLYLASRMLNGRQLEYLALLTPVALSMHLYFTYAENFLTARLFSEAIALWGLGIALRKRAVPSFVVLGLAVAMHPLVGAGPTAVAIIYLWGRKPWLWLGLLPAGLALVLLAGTLHIAPFTDVLRSYDPAWFRTVWKRDGFCFVTNWTWTVWVQILAYGVLIALSVRRLAPDVRPMLWSILFVAAVSLLVSVIGSDLAHNVLVVGLQPWRALWLLALVGNLALGLEVAAGASLGLRTMSFGHGLLALSGMSSCVAVVCPAMSIIATPLMLIAALVVAVERRWPRLVPGAESFPSRLVVGLVAGLLLIVTSVVAGIPDTSQWADLAVLQAARWRTAGLLLVAVLLAGWSRSLTRQSLLAVWAAFAAVAILTVDARSPWASYVEAGETPPALAAHFPDKGDILWEGDIRVPWLLLRRASYVSCDQGTGALFNRRTAGVYVSRVDQVSAVTAFDAADFCPITKRIAARIAAPAIRALCQSAPDLAYVVVSARVGGLFGDEVDVPPHEVVLRESNGVMRTRVERQYIYRCANLRSGRSADVHP